MSKSKAKNIKLVYTIAGFLFGLMFPVVAYMVLKIENPLISKNELLANYLFVIICLAPIVLSLAANLIALRFSKTILKLEDERDNETEIISETIDFVNSIGSGNYNTSISDTSKNETLFSALTLMGKNLKESAETESERSWIINGETEVGDILRANNNIKNLADELIVFLTKKLNVIQCAFYVYNDEDEKNPFIELISTYAFNRKKYLTPTFKMGQGLVGQALIEGATIYRTEIPEDYATITSGLLGDKKPKSILIVPLITDEKVYGALEFSSIKEIPNLHIQFLNEISDIIARTIFNLSVNDKTLRLLNDSQKMSSELQLQREQLLQSAEEMQITQEELSKSNNNLETQIEEVNKSQQRMHTLLKNASELITVFDEQQIIKYISPSVTNILGYNTEDFIGRKSFLGLNPKGERDVNAMFENLVKTPDKIFTLEFSLESKEGNRIWLETHGQNLMTDPAIEGIVFNSRDITMRRKAEKEEKKSGQMQALSENSVDLIVRLNEEGRFFYINPTIQKFTGLMPDDFTNQTLDEVPLNKTFVEFCKTTLATIFDTKQKAYLETPYNNGFSNYILRVAAIPELDENDEPETVLLVFHDITEQKMIELQIKEKNKNITESINYSYNIQSSLMPNARVIQSYFSNSFMFYEPKDVVSGDFPWLYANGVTTYIATVDCTGHGVPGALMSFIGHFTLNNILVKTPDLNCGEILDKMHQEVQRVLRQDVKDSQSRDGMDIALCKYNHETHVLDFSGAHRPLYLLRNNEFEEVKGDKYPIAGMHYKNRKNFVNHSIQLNNGDSFYFFTDGLPDQFGGPTGKEKILSSRIQEHIIQNKNLEMNEMGDSVDFLFTKWKGKVKQLDDVLMIGIKI